MAADKGVALCDDTGNAQRILDANGSNHVSVEDTTGTEIMDIENHATRHAYGGDDAIPDNSLHFSQVDKVLATAETTINVAASSTSTIDKGIYYARADSGVNIEYSTDNGTTWVALAAPALIISDGSNVRFNNTNASAANGYLLLIS